MTSHPKYVSATDPNVLDLAAAMPVRECGSRRIPDELGVAKRPWVGGTRALVDHHALPSAKSLSAGAKQLWNGPSSVRLPDRGICATVRHRLHQKLRGATSHNVHVGAVAQMDQAFSSLFFAQRPRISCRGARLELSLPMICAGLPSRRRRAHARLFDELLHAATECVDGRFATTPLLNWRGKESKISRR